MHTIAVMPADGTGPEVVQDGLKVLSAAAGTFRDRSADIDSDFRGARAR